MNLLAPLKKNHFIYTLAILLFSQTGFAEQPTVLTSIKPLQLIAADIGRGVISASTLIPATASPHEYALRPSDIRRVKGAEIVFWVGPELETFLSKVFTTNTDSAVNFSDLIHPIEQQAAGQQEHNGHDHANGDPHIWLSPEGAAAIAQRMAIVLSAKFPTHSSAIDHNLQQFITQLDTLDKQIEAQLSPLRQRPFIVFHDGYSAFVEHYQLQQLAALTINPSQQPGAKHLAGIRQLIAKRQPSCIFSEPQFNANTVASIVQGSATTVVKIDPLATNIEAQDMGYIVFLKEFAGQFEQCLSAS